MPDHVVPEDARARAPGQGEVRTREQAVNHLEQLYREMLALRDQCDHASTQPGDVQAKRVFWAFLVKQGQLDGAAKAFSLAGLVSEAAYTEFHQRALNALAPKVGRQVTLG
jgi:hypothetical protein